MRSSWRIVISPSTLGYHRSQKPKLLGKVDRNLWTTIQQKRNTSLSIWRRDWRSNILGQLRFVIIDLKLDEEIGSDECSFLRNLQWWTWRISISARRNLLLHGEVTNHASVALHCQLGENAFSTVLYLAGCAHKGHHQIERERERKRELHAILTAGLNISTYESLTRWTRARSCGELL